MKKHLLLLFLISSLSFAQTQIGIDIDGENIFTKTFGNAIGLSADGNIVVIGASFSDANGINSRTGRVRVYQNQSGTWTQVGGDINGDTNDFLGTSVAISADGSIIAVSSQRQSTSVGLGGSVQVYENQSGTWIQVGSTIYGEDADDRFGASVSLSSDGNILAVGATDNDGNGNDSGHVRVYQNQTGAWIQIGNDIDGEWPSDRSGSAVALSQDGSIVAIGAQGNDDNGANSGHVRVYQNQTGAWTQIGNDIDGENTSDFSGTSLSLSANGSKVAIGAVGNNANGNRSGHVRVYENQSGNWIQVGSDIDGEGALDDSGYSVDLSNDGNILAIGAPYNTNSNGISGHVRIYKNTSGNWVQVGADINGETFGDECGSSVSLSADGNTVAIGAPQAINNNGLDTGHVRVFNLSAILSTPEASISKVHLSPNPATDQFTIQLGNNDILKNVSIYDNLGRLVLNTKNSDINTSSMTTGLYVVRIETEKGQASKKIIIE